MVEELALQIPFKKTIERGDVLLLVEDDGCECRTIFAQALKVAFKTIDGEEWVLLDLVHLTVPLTYGSLSLKQVQMSDIVINKTAERDFFIKAVNTQGFFNSQMAFLAKAFPAPELSAPKKPIKTPVRHKAPLRLVKPEEGN
jgi:hypothetical protein